MSNPSLDWERLQDVFYRSRRCFDINWSTEESDEQSIDSGSNKVNLEDSIVAISHYCACIALYPKSSNSLTSNSGFKSRSIDIYSGSGSKLTSIPWLASNGEIVSLLWTSDFKLIVVFKNGLFRAYFNLSGDFNEHTDLIDSFKSNNSDDETSSNEIVLDCKPYDYGFVVYTSKKRFIGVSIDTKIRLTKFPALTSIPIKDPSVHGWTIVARGISRPIKLIVSTVSQLISLIPMSSDSTSNGKVKSTDYTKIKSPDEIVGPFKFISMTPNGDFVSLYSQISNTVYILTSDFEHLLSSFVCNSSNDIPLQLEWCSNDAVILSFKEELKVIGPSPDESLNYYLDSPVYLQPEYDGIYFLGNSSLDFLSRVSDITIDIFKIGSTSPGAILLDAIDYIDNHSPKANENLDMIKDNLVEAIDHCIRGSVEEFDTYWQKKLLRAVIFGKNSTELYNSDEFVETCNSLRILNILRQPEVGIFMTYSQLQALGLDELIQLLLFRKLHFLAFKISQFLELPQDNIFIDWACCKIKSSQEVTDDDKLFNIISKKLNERKSTVSYSEIAKVAYEEGRLPLSIKLINLESDTSRQIPLLLEMEEDEFALLKSEENLDTDSSLFILITLLNKLSISDFFKILNKKPNTVSLFKSKIGVNSKELLNGFYYQDDSIYGMACMELDNLLIEGKVSTSNTKKQVKNLSSILSRSKKTELNSHLLKENTLKLVELQERVKKNYGLDFDFTTESATDLIDKLLTSGTADLQTTLNIGKELKLNERQLYWKTVKKLGSSPGLKEQLYEFANLKKSPIGYEPFYLSCLENNDKRQAAIYVDMCTNLSYKQRVKMFIRCDDFKKAIDECFKKKDIALLDYIGTLTDNSVIARLIHDYKDRLR